jgi:Tol biopolymer transport system component
LISLLAIAGLVVAVTAALIWPRLDAVPYGAGSARAAFPGSNGKIAFFSDRDGNYEIYSMNADGSGQTNLTNNAAADEFTKWSSDGTKIAFASDRDGNAEVYSMNADGSGQTRLTNNAAFDLFPVWSPDGSRIAFSTTRDGNYEVYSMNADGSGQTRLTNNAAIDFAPDWSPDGTKIAFTSIWGGNPEVYVMNEDGSGQTNLTNNAAIDLAPVWSPDGTKITFESDRDGNREIYSMNADGSGQTRLTSNAAFDGKPAWSPDGTKIAFDSDRDGNSEIYVMNADGSSPTRLTNNAAFDGEPDWQAIPLAGLVGYWKFDEASGTMAADSSPNGYDGTLVNGATFSAGKSGRAVQLDDASNQYVSIGDQPGLAITGGLTISTWIYPTDLSTYGHIVTRRAPGCAGPDVDYQLLHRPTGEVVAADGTFGEVSSGRFLNLNAWNFVAATHNGATHQWFFNVNGVTSTATGGALGTLAGPVEIGQGKDCPSNNAVKGLIDEVRIYNRRLSPAEIDSLYGLPVSVLGALGVSGSTATLQAGSDVSWVCEAGDPGASVAIRFSYDSGTQDITGTGRISLTQVPPTNVLHSVRCVVNGVPGPTLMVDWFEPLAASGVVSDSNSGLPHLPVIGATVLLQIEDPPNSGTYRNVDPISDAAIIAPDINPETTDLLGRYAWTVAPGRYRVAVSVPALAGSSFIAGTSGACASAISLPVVDPGPFIADVPIACDDTDADGLDDRVELDRTFSSPTNSNSGTFGIGICPLLPCFTGLDGTNPIVKDDAEDPDGDGFNNLQEIRLGTAPLVSLTADSDGDGCPNGKEQQTAIGSQTSGGLRDSGNPWDYFEPTHNHQNRIDDVLKVVHQFFKDSGNPAYNPDTDRTYVGPNPWNLGPPDGQQRVDDILHSVHQFFHDCI